MARTSSTRVLHTGPQSPRLSIMKILKRRKKNLTQWASELGLTTLANAVDWCARVGVLPPTKEEWKQWISDPDLPPLMNDPSGGIIVIDQKMIMHSDDDEIISVSDVISLETESIFEEQTDSETSEFTKKRRTKKLKSDNQ